MLHLDPDDPLKTRVTTRDGREARILAYEPDHDFCLFGMLKSLNGKWYPAAWKKNGDYFNGTTNRPDDLINAPPPEVVLYANVYRRDGYYCYLYPSRERADHEASPERLHCAEIRFPKPQP